jgi:hypothetical protein
MRFGAIVKSILIKWLCPLNGMLDRFMLAILAHWEKYEEWYFTQNAAPTYYFPFYYCVAKQPFS